MMDRPELPKLMRTLPRDARGYPIPFLVMVDKTGLPQFTINDDRKATACRTKRLCAICGKRFTDGMWFVGGARSFLHEHGAFVDPPMHLECAEYALRVCPFLAASKYLRRIDAAKLKPDAIPEGIAIARRDHMPPSLPERFGLGFTQHYDYLSQPAVFVVPRWDYVEWWRQGELCNAPDAGSAQL
jgi:hypothetical protein